MVLERSNNSLLIGSQHIRLKRVNSTNKYAIDIISKSKPIEGTVISASFQYDGRGQIGRFWESEDGKNITCSTILHPTFLLARNQFQMNMAVSLAIFDFIDHFLSDVKTEVKIKWPNDLYVNDKKIAGILIQNTIKGKYINASVVGTGININQIDFSPDIPNPTSLAKILDVEIEIESAYFWLFRFLTKRYLQLSTGQSDQLRSAYLKHLYRKDKKSSFKGEDENVFEGTIRGVDDVGQLMIEMEDQSIRSFAYRAIQFIV